MLQETCSPSAIDNQPLEDNQTSNGSLAPVNSDFVIYQPNSTPEAHRPNATTAFSDLVPVPRCSARKSMVLSDKKRKVGHADIITGSPYKRALEETVSKSTGPMKATKKIRSQNNRSGTKRKSTVDQIRPRPLSSPVPECNADETPCIYCEIAYCNSNVPWLRCRICGGWSCGRCISVGKKNRSPVVLLGLSQTDQLTGIHCKKIP